MSLNYSRLYDRRSFITTSVLGFAWTSIPYYLHFSSPLVLGKEPPSSNKIKAVVRPELLFAGIRKPITKRADLEPRIEQLKKVCAAKAVGPLTHIFRFDTPVEGYDSEIGFPVSEPINEGEVKTHTLRTLHFYSLLHEGPVSSLGETTTKLYEYMNVTGLSPELELVEVYHNYDQENPQNMKIEDMASFLAWPEVYQQQLTRVLGTDMAAQVWSGGAKMTPHTTVDERCDWVASSINQLKQCSTVEQQFDILSRVALIRPSEDVAKYKKIYDENKDITTVFKAQNEQLEKSPNGGYIDPPRYDGKILHVSKVPYKKKAYHEAKTPKQIRKAYCFCNLVREAENPQMDPIFCYRAAGWARQFWEPILGVQFKKCQITHSILKGDKFCAWDYYLS